MNGLEVGISAYLTGRRKYLNIKITHFSFNSLPCVCYPNESTEVRDVKITPHNMSC